MQCPCRALVASQVIFIFIIFKFLCEVRCECACVCGLCEQHAYLGGTGLVERAKAAVQKVFAFVGKFPKLPKLQIRI